MRLFGPSFARTRASPTCSGGTRSSTRRCFGSGSSMSAAAMPTPGIAHVLCEVYVRLRAVGLINGQAFEMPITQAELGDATGLSTVHVNRTLQDLRGHGLISTP